MAGYISPDGVREREPGGRPQAPGPLGVAQAFINTWDREDDIDVLDSAHSLGVWLAARGLLVGPPEEVEAQAADLTFAIEIREALRAMAAANHAAETPPRDAVRTIEDASSRIGFAFRLGERGSLELDPSAGGIDGALGRILRIVFAEMAAGRWSRLKVCDNDVCRWAFYDRSRNRSGRWCTMALCGNRTKVEAWRERNPDE